MTHGHHIKEEMMTTHECQTTTTTTTTAQCQWTITPLHIIFQRILLLWSLFLCRWYCNYLIDGMIFDTKYITCETCTLITTFMWKFSKHNKNSATYHYTFMYFFMQSACYFYPFLTNTEYHPTDFCKKPLIQNLVKIRPGGATLFRMCRHMIKLQVIVALFNSANAPKTDAYFCETQ
jgi:hypothetical protein